MTGRTWKNLSSKQIMQIKEMLMKNGKEDLKLDSHEEWRIRVDGAVFTAYKKGTIYWNGESYNNVQTIIEKIDKIAGLQFKSTNKEILLGFDEVGKGDIICSLIAVGVRFPRSLYKDVEEIISTADTKRKHERKYWYKLYKEIRRFEERGLHYEFERIYANEIDNRIKDGKTINELLDEIYARLLDRLEIDNKCSVIIDNYRIGKRLKEKIERLKERGDIRVEKKADDNYLEVKLASIIARYMKERELEEEGNSIGIDIKNGNINYLKKSKCLEILKKKKPNIIRWSFLKN